MNNLSISKRKGINIHSFLTFLLLVCLLFSSHYVWSQEKNAITLNVKNETVESIFSQIGKQTGLKFFYDQEVVDTAPRVSINVKNASLQSVLDKITVQTQLYFNRKNNTISVGKQVIVDTSISSHKKVISGRVVDQTGEPVIGASVVVKGTSNGYITDVDGNYMLTDVPEDAVISVSYVGYQTVELKVGNKDLAKIILKEDSELLDEVVVVAYGTQKKINLTGSVTSVSTEDIKDRVQTDVLSAVQGTVPGVTVISRPGQEISVNFRGRGNLGTSAPLYVIDGVVADATFFSNLDPNSIESISFLKDAASASIYGSRAAYGVVLVTTKQGKKEKTNVSYSGYISFDNPTYKPEYVNSVQHAILYNEALYNSNPSAGKYQRYSEEQIGWFRDGSKPDEYPNTDWNDLILDRNVVSTQHSLNLSGGSEKVSYYAGLGYVYRDNIIPGKDMTRYNLDLSVNADLTDWLSIKGGMKFFQKHDDRDRGEPSLANFSIVPSTFVAKQTNGDWGTVNGGSLAENNFINYNPLRALSKGDWQKKKTEKTMYNLGFDLKPIKGLTISGQGSYTGHEYKDKMYTALQDNAIDYFSGEKISGTGNAINKMKMDWRSASNMLYTGIVRYDWSKNIHNLNILLGASYEHYKYEQLTASRQNFITDSMTDISAGATTGANYKNGGESYEYKMLSYFGRINYSLMDRYLFEVNFRADASSRFHKDNRWGWFPSFSAGWRISEEAFMKDVEWIDNLKLRASYGTLGNINNVGYYDYFQTYSSSNIHYTFDNVDVPGVAPGKVANRSLGWEKVALTDVGIDLDLFNGMLSLTADYYIKKTSDILLKYNVPEETGISSNEAPSQNLGKVKNVGLELGISHRHHIGSVKYSIAANIATNCNRVVDMGTSNNLISNASHILKYILREGEAVGSYYGYQTDGLYTQEEIDTGKYYLIGGRKPNAGDIKFVPQRDIAYGESLTDDDRTIIGKDVPSFTYGLNLNLEWKGFELTLFGQGVGGANVAFDVYGVHPFFHGQDSPRKFHLKRWTEENPNPNAAYPRIYTAGDAHTMYNRNFSSYQVFDADYFRVKTLSLGYTIPKHYIKNWGLQNLKVFVTGENLFTFRADNRMEDFDPENASGVIYNLGTKSIALGVNVSF